MARNSRERTDATRLALLEAARRLFVKNGYADTATPDIVAAAGVTRGALYHHFEDKRALFRATVEHEAQAVAQDIIASSSSAKTPRAALLHGASAYFDAMTVPGRTRLLLLEAPAILGVGAAEAIDQDNAEATLRMGLADLMGDRADDATLSALTKLLSAAFDRAAIAIDQGEDRKTFEAAIAALLDGITA